MGNTEDFYEVLNILRESSPEQIRRAYKILVKKWHPDKHPPSSKPEAEARFKAISQAYELALNESEGRTACGFSGGSGGGAPNLRRSKPPPPAPGFRTEETLSPRKSVVNPKDVRYTTSQSGSAWPKPPPVEKQLDCTLEELFNGCRKEIRFHRDVVVNGVVIRKEEMQKVKVKPGWKKGTKITFEGMGTNGRDASHRRRLRDSGEGASPV
ncbi:hypothetical protein HPP92_006883 [Vanilla planifolia]|uniref:J domain-containing protein n=1 Tax=Vanilla planifolia TaxID=51239 RepID=A0A835RLA8_VANPL|nr:hypothetical protein HPP92_006883 [Vanilla planifolia]